MKFAIKLFVGVLAFVLIVSGIQEICERIIIEKRTLTAKSEQIIRLLEKMDTEDPRIPIGYGRYGYMHPDLSVNCLDYSFAFAILYGEGAWVSSNEDHAFVTVNGTIIEPNQIFLRNRYVTEYRMKGVNYNIRKSVAHFNEADIKAVYNYFGLGE